MNLQILQIKLIFSKKENKPLTSQGKEISQTTLGLQTLFNHSDLRSNFQGLLFNKKIIEKSKQNGGNTKIESKDKVFRQFFFEDFVKGPIQSVALTKKPFTKFRDFYNKKTTNQVSKGDVDLKNKFINGGHGV